MEITGEIIAILPMVEGQGKNGVWTKRDYILEVPGQYPKKVCFSLWNAKIDEYLLKEGQKVTAHIDIESREYNSRWYTEVKAFRVDKLSGGNERDEPVANVARAADPVPSTMFNEDEQDDLPF